MLLDQGYQAVCSSAPLQFVASFQAPGDAQIESLVIAEEALNNLTGPASSLGLCPLDPRKASTLAL